MNFCPVPHKQREFGWLAVGILATVAYYSFKKDKIKAKTPKVVDKVRVVTTEHRKIDEYCGIPSAGDASVSIALVEVDSKGKGQVQEPGAIPGFDEVVLVIEGSMRVECDGTMIEGKSGQALHLPRGRHYDYIFPSGKCKYVPICLPAFSPDLAPSA